MTDTWIDLYMDDCRRPPAGFAWARTTGECLLMLRECKVRMLSLDYDMGPEEMTGGDVARFIVLENLYPKAIYLHTSSALGRKEMFETLYPAVPEGTVLHNGPLPPVHGGSAIRRE